MDDPVQTALKNLLAAVDADDGYSASAHRVNEAREAARTTLKEAPDVGFAMCASCDMALVRPDDPTLCYAFCKKCAESSRQATAEAEADLANVRREREQYHQRTAKIEAERDEARQWVERMQQEQVLTCVYCGQAYEPGTPAHGTAALTAHIKECVKHPMRAAEAALYVPDNWVCPKCGFVWHTTNLLKQMRCANDDTVLQRQTWEERAKESMAVVNRQGDEAEALLPLVQAAELWEAARLQREGHVPKIGATPFNDPAMARMLPDAKAANEAITAALANVPERFRNVQS